MRYLSDRLPQARRAPASVLAAVRAVDPRADLLYIGEGEWWLGVMQPNSHRRRIGAAIARREWARPHPRWETLRYAECAVQGFAYVLTVHGDLTGAVVERFREADWRYRHERPAFDEFMMNSPELEMLHTERSYLKSRAAADIRAHTSRVVARREQFHASLN